MICKLMFEIKIYLHREVYIADFIIWTKFINVHIYHCTAVSFVMDGLCLVQIMQHMPSWQPENRINRYAIIAALSGFPQNYQKKASWLSMTFPENFIFFQVFQPLWDTCVSHKYECDIVFCWLYCYLLIAYVIYLLNSFGLASLV